MSEEEKAIEYLKILKKHLGKNKQKMIDRGTYKFYEAFEINLDTALNLITKLQKENEEKDKKIDLMAEWIFDKDYRENSLLIHRDDYYSNCIKQVKKHFEKLAKEKGE